MAGGIIREPGLAGERLTSGLAEEDRALAGVCKPDADDFDDAMIFGVCHGIDSGVYHMIPPNHLPADYRLKAVPSRLWMLNIDPLVDARPIGKLDRGVGTRVVQDVVTGSGTENRLTFRPVARRLACHSSYCNCMRSQ